MIQNKDLTINKGTTKTYELIFKRDGKAEDITGWTIYFTCKKNMTDSDAQAKINKTITSHSDPTQGKTLIELSTLDTALTGSYHYSIDYKDADGKVGILFEGRVNFRESVRNTRD